MKTKKLLMLLAVAGMIIFASCKKDDSPSPLTKDEATTEINAVNADFSTEQSAYMTDEKVQVMNAVNNLDLTFIGGPSLAPMQKSSFKKDILRYYNPDAAIKGGDPFWNIDWAASTGTWKNVNGTWTKTSTTPSDKIVVIFSYGTGTDNGTLTFSNYDDKTLTVEGVSLVYMSQLNATVQVDGVTVYSVAYTASLSGGSTSANFKMKFVYNVGIYTLTQSVGIATNVSESSAKFILSMLEELKKSGEVLRAISYTATMTSTQTASSVVIEAKHRIKNIVVKLKVDYTEGVTDFQGDPSNFMQISIWTADGAKVADVVFKLESGYYVPYLKYTDGTEVLLTQAISDAYYQDLSDFRNQLFDLNFSMFK